MSFKKSSYVFLEILTTIIVVIIMPFAYYVIWQVGLWSFNDFRLALIISFVTAGVTIIVTLVVPKLHLPHRKRHH